MVSLIYSQINPRIDISQYHLQRDGICIIKNTFTDQELGKLVQECKSENHKQVKEFIIKHSNLKDALVNKTDSEYEFHDYIFILKKSAIHTCHRDANGDMFNDIKHPSYTMILYLEDMDKCLGIIPQSHYNNNQYSVNLTNQVKDVLCKKGDILLFDANIIHTGIILENPDNLRIQMKFSHKDDIPRLGYYTNYNKILSESNTMPKFVQTMQQNISCMFPIISDFTQTDVKNTTKYKSNSDIPVHQRIFAYLFYGNSNYYNLANAIN